MTPLLIKGALYVCARTGKVFQYEGVVRSRSHMFAKFREPGNIEMYENVPLHEAGVRHLQKGKIVWSTSP